MSALDWLRERQKQTLKNQAIFDATPFEQTAHGFKARNYKQPVQQRNVAPPMPQQAVQPTNSVKRFLPASPRFLRASPLREDNSPVAPSRVGANTAIAQRRFPLSMRQQPEVKNTWVQKNGDTTLKKEWVSEAGDGPPTNAEGPSMEVSPGESIADPETWGGKYNLTMPQDPITRRWIKDPASILNIGNLIKGMGRTFQGVDDKLERNRINSLMKYRTTNPYYRSGGIY